MGNSITNWMLWKSPSAKDIWQGADSKTISVFDKVIKVKNKIFVGKSYLTEGLFKPIIFFCSYLLESNCLWHECLGHVKTDQLRNFA